MNADSNLAALLRQLKDDTATLLQEEVALAKTELSEKVSSASRNLIYLAAGGFIASSALLLALMAFAYLLAEFFMRREIAPGMAVFLGFLVVSTTVGSLSWVLISRALKHLGQESVTPEKTVQSLREDKQWAQSKLS